MYSRVSSQRHSGFLALIILIFTSFTFTACLSTSNAELPDWALVRPTGDDEALYFVAKGGSRGGDETEALAIAEERLLETVLDELTPSGEEEFSEQYRDELERFRRQLKRELKRVAPGTGLRIESSYFREYADDRGELYLLASYPRSLWEAKRRELELLRRSPRDLVSALSGEAEKLLDRHAYFPATRKFLDAAAATRFLAEPFRTEEQIKLLQAAREAVEVIRILPLSSGVNGVKGRSFERPFEVQVLYRYNGTEVGAEGVVLLADYPVLLGEDIVRAQERLRSTGEGIVRFSPPVPEYSGQALISMGLDFSDSLASIEFSPEAAVELALFETVAAKGRAVFPIQVRSPAIGLRTGIYLVDSDLSGNLTGRRDSAAGVAGVLSGEGYDLELVEAAPGIFDGSADEILLTIRERYGVGFNRFVYGSARIVSFKEEQGKFSVTVAARVRAVELPSGRLLYSREEISRSAIGSNSQSAINSAFRQLGKVIGEELVTKL